MHAQEYYSLIKTAIRLLNKPTPQKEHLLLLAEFGLLKTCLIWTSVFAEAAAYQQQWIDTYISLLRCFFSLPDRVGVTLDNMRYFFNVVEKLMLNEPLLCTLKTPIGRIFGYGALGRIAKKYLPLLVQVCDCPVVLWDKAANDASYFDTIQVTKPDFQALTKEDFLVVFPVSYAVQKEVGDTLEKLGIEISCIYNYQLIDFLSLCLFPFFSANGSCARSIKAKPLFLESDAMFKSADDLGIG